jgi:hypothetical protein
MNKRERILATFALVGVVLTCLGLTYNEIAPPFVLAMAVMIAPILFGVIVVTSMSLTNFGLLLVAIGFASAFVFVPFALLAIVSLGTAGRWYFLAIPPAIVSVLVFAFGLLVALLGAIFYRRTNDAPNEPVAIPPPAHG